MKYDFVKCTFERAIDYDKWMISSIADELEGMRELARDFNCVENMMNITSTTSTWETQKRIASDYANFSASARTLN